MYSQMTMQIQMTQRTPIIIILLHNLDLWQVSISSEKPQSEGRDDQDDGDIE